MSIAERSTGRPPAATHPHPQPTTEDGTSQHEHRSWWVLIVALAAQVLVVLDISVVNTALPTIGHSLHLRSGDLQWLVTAYLLMSGGGLLLGGRIADLMPRRRMFLTGLAVFTSASVMSGLAGTAGVLIAARAGQGLGAAAMTPAALSIIMTTYAGAQRAKGLALWGVVGSLGVAAGVLLGGVLTSWAGWQMIFWINVPVGVAAFCASLVVIPRDDQRAAGLTELDLPGAGAVVAGLAALLLAIQGAGSHGWTSARTIVLLGVAGALLAAFTMIERRVSRPLVPPHTWKIKSLVSSTGVMLGITGVLVGVIFITSIFVQTVLGFSAVQTGLAFLPLAAAMIVGTHVASRLLKHIAPRNIAVAGLGLTIAGALLLSTASRTAHYAANILPSLLILGFGIGLVFVAVSVTAMAGIPAQHAGMASGFLMTGHEIGAAMGVAIVSAVSATAGSLTTASGVADGFARGLVAAAVLSAVAAAVAFATMPATRATGAAHLHLH